MKTNPFCDLQSASQTTDQSDTDSPFAGEGQEKAVIGRCNEKEGEEIVTVYTENEVRSFHQMALQGWASVLYIFCIGTASGAAGGLLLGATGVVVLQCLELLADNRLLMDLLQKDFIDDYHFRVRVQVHDIHISVFAEVLGFFCSILTLTAGIPVGLSVYSLVVKKHGDAAMGKALGFAGPVSLMGITATGCVLGFALERLLLSTTLLDSILLTFFIPVGILSTIIITAGVRFNTLTYHLFFLWIFAPIAVFCIPAIGLVSNMRIVLVAGLIPVIIAVKELGELDCLKLTAVNLPLTLTIYDLFNSAGKQIVFLQSPTSTSRSNAVLEAIFVGVLTSLLWTVTVGMALFVSWQKGGAGRICAIAAACGAAVLGAIKFALPVLGPVPLIGALMGVAGAVGVSLSAAVAATDHHQCKVNKYGLVGKVGVTVGAAGGSFLCSLAHGGLSGTFMGLFAATVPAGAFLKVTLVRLTLWRLFLALWICIYVGVVLLAFVNIITMGRAVYMFFVGNIYMNLYLWFLYED